MLNKKYFPKVVTDARIAIIGLGYVGLPLAVTFSSKYPTFGFDKNINRISKLKKFIDKTGEIEEKKLKEVSEKLHLTDSILDITNCNVFIITVPTPVDSSNTPDLTPLSVATSDIGKILKKGDCVIFESTVYPGATDEFCIPILEQTSGLKVNEDFICGYSPERVNPGDKKRTIEKIIKITSGSNSFAADFVNNLYSSVIIAGTHRVSSIKVAESAKIIENTQRDINIAFVNELMVILEKMNLDIFEVLDAAKTKWNFLPFEPGLVGGHCIGVDTYYLAHKSKELGCYPEIISASRRLNESMANYVSTKIAREVIPRHNLDKPAKILLMGCTFKENCPDIRNSKVFDVIKELKAWGFEVFVYDSLLNKSHFIDKDVVFLEELPKGEFDAVLITVPHNQFINLTSKELSLLLNPEGSMIFWDFKKRLRGIKMPPEVKLL